MPGTDTFRRHFKGSSLDWAGGALLALAGTVFLIAPNLVDFVQENMLPVGFWAWGGTYLVAGLALLTFTVQAPAVKSANWVRTLAGAMLVWLGVLFGINGAWITGVNYASTGCGVIASAWLLAHERSPQEAAGKVHLFPLVAGLAALASGLILLISPQKTFYQAVSQDPTLAVVFGLLFTLSGGFISWVYLAEISPLRFKNPEATRRAAHLALAAVFLFFAMFSAAPNRFWLGVAFHAGAALLLLLIVYRPGFLVNYSWTSLGTRFTVLMGIIAALPLVIGFAIVSEQEEISVKSEALEQLQSQSAAISEAISINIAMHQAMLQTIANEPELFSLPPTGLQAYLEGIRVVNPEVLAYYLYHADGSLAASSNLPANDNENNQGLVAQVRESRQPVAFFLHDSPTGTLMFIIGVPLKDGGGNYSGVLSLTGEASLVGHLLGRLNIIDQNQVVLVDRSGVEFASSERPVTDAQSIFPAWTEISQSVLAISSGSVKAQDGEDLYGFSQVPGYPWYVIVHQAELKTLASVHESRNIALGILLVFLIGTTAAGLLLGHLMTRPLKSLEVAALRAAEGKLFTRLHASQIDEIQALEDVFDNMLRRLADRTTQQEAAEQALIRANEALEARVTERTVELNESNAQLQSELDIRRQVEDALRESEEQLRQALQAASMTAWDWNVESGEVRLSEGANTTWGVDQKSHEDAIQLIHPEDRARVVADVREVVEKGGAFAIEFRVFLPDGQDLRWVEIRGRRRTDTEDQSRHIEGILMDITERKHVEQVLRESQERYRAASQEAQLQAAEAEQGRRALHLHELELQKANQELQDFVFFASHDLQEPLRKIRAFSDRILLQFSDQLNPEGLDYIERMLNATNRMQTMLHDLLELSRVMTSSQPFNRIDLQQVVADVLSDLEERIEATGGEVTVGPLPVIEAEAVQMRQLFQNLIGNGLKYHTPGEPPQVAITCRRWSEAGERNGEKIELWVEDNGIGFDMQYRERIFQPFQRLHGRSEYDGTGIGLAICRKIVERHGGSISAESAPGKGAKFIVILPVTQPHAIEEENLRQEAAL